MNDFRSIFFFFVLHNLATKRSICLPQSVDTCCSICKVNELPLHEHNRGGRKKKINKRGAD